ncbi:hypothetical protein NLU13_9877 [Sarocladium strictum]|uniref:Uncharacterized protein n=1 Tax=Sarocladium strictum TaxID=5046 RepID=A0AA39GAW8_SARSR|nr:hypothetical protein NLU13_9877 [Sarocladium strictum]
MDEAKAQALAIAREAAEANKKSKPSYSLWLDNEWDIHLNERSWILHPDVRTGIIYSYQQFGVEDGIEHAIGIREKHDTPTSCEDFLIKTSPLFSNEFIKRIQTSLEEFDRKLGVPLADVFISEMSTLDLAATLVSRCFEYSDPEKPSLPTPSVPIPSYITPSVTSEEPIKSWGLMLDGTDEGPPPYYMDSPADRVASAPSPMVLDPSVHGAQAPMQQIKLVGPTLKQAWDANPIVQRHLMVADAMKEVKSDWTPNIAHDTPGVFSRAPAFHGTCSHHDRDNADKRLEKAMATLPSGFTRNGNPSQIYPGRIDGTGGFFTSFLAFRAFAFSVFKMCLFQDIPNGTHLGWLHRAFTMRNTEWTGVILLKFWSQQGAPPGQDFYTVPESNQRIWASTCKKFAVMDSLGDEQNCWAKLRPIHRQATADYPDLVHMREQDSVIQAFNKANVKVNKGLLWQTAWMSDRSMEYLNSRFAECFAITWEDPSPQLPVNPETQTTKAGTDAPPGTKKRGRQASLGRIFDTLRKKKNKNA